MKKIIAICFLTLILTMTACGKPAQNPDSTSENNTATGAVTEGQTTPETVAETIPETVPETEPVTELETEPQTEEGFYTYDHISLKLPDGFQAADYSGMIIAVHEDYPTVSDNIVFSKDTSTDSVDNYTQQLLDEVFSNTVAGFEKSTAFEKMKIDGVDVLKYSFEITTSGVHQTQTQYWILGSAYMDVISFTSVSGNFDEAFEQSFQSLKIR